MPRFPVVLALSASLLLPSCGEDSGLEADGFVAQDEAEIVKAFPTAEYLTSCWDFVSKKGRRYFPFIDDAGFSTGEGFSIPYGPTRKDGSRTLRRVGRWRFYYSGNDLDGPKCAVGQYASGKKSGVWKFWYPSSVERAIGAFVEGEMDGSWEIRKPDGSIDKEQSGLYRAGKRVEEAKKKAP